MTAPSSKLSLGMLLAIAALLSIHLGLALGSKLTSSTAMDELVHLTAGTSYWRYNDYRLHPENGNLSQRWAALPAALQQAPFPATTHLGWQTSDAWYTGYAFFYESPQDHFPLLMAGRAMITLFSLATALIVFFWARSLFGNPAALFALSLYTFSPDTLAHGALVTSDMAMTLFFLASLALYWRHLHDKSILLLFLSSAVFGLAWVAKFSAITLLPVFGLLAILRILRPAPLLLGKFTFSSAYAKALALTGSFILHGFVAAGIIWLFYACRYSAFNPSYPPAGQFIYPWEQHIAAIGLPGKILELAAQWKVLPEAFLYGFAFVLNMMRARASFLDGEYSMTGWRHFFIFSFLYKTPASLLIILMGPLFIFFRAFAIGGFYKLRPLLCKIYSLAPLLIFFLVYWILSITSNLNIGHRHILPTYPILFILCGALFTPHFRAVFSLRPLFKLGLLLVFVVESLSSFPDFISYYNPIAGGQQHGWRHLIDSSTDWGQGLPAIAKRIQEFKKDPDCPPIFLSYFGASSHKYYHIDAEMLPCSNLFGIRYKTARLRAGIYCISATMLQQVHSSAKGPWDLAMERRYQELSQLEPFIRRYQNDPSSRPELEKNRSVGFWNIKAAAFDEIRFARLCHYLRAKGPDEVISGSFLIFRLSQHELDSCLQLPFSEWNAWIAASSSRPQG